MAERLSIINDPPRILEGPRLLHHLISWEKHYDLYAIDCTSNNRRQQYTYREIHYCMASLACRIQDILETKHGNTQLDQHIIPLLLPQSPGLYISQLAILSSGGAFCPVNLDAPKERIKFIAEDVNASVIITTPQLSESVTWENGPIVIYVDEFPVFEPETVHQTSAFFEVKPDDLAYVMYTSGSTGLPKGVGVSHFAVSQSLLAHERHIPPFRRFLQFAAPSFDVSVFEIFFPLARGCTLVGCNRTQLLNDLPGMINRLYIDAAEFTPTVVGSLLQKRSNVPALRLLLTIGEMLTTPIVKEFGGSDTQSNILYGMYGPTEAAIHCIVHSEMAKSTKPGNIGTPFDSVSAFIVAASSSADEAANLRFLPVGELGELALGGPQLAKGYINREDQNKVAFVEFEGRKYYRTGDKAKQLEDGTIEIHGRISGGQVKLRGQRIELGEIEEVVYKHPGVKTVVAKVIGSALTVFALVDDKIRDPEEVISTCSKWLPKFMLPSEIILLNSFPYLPSGKVDKTQLEDDYRKKLIEEEDDDATSKSGIEEAVRGILHEFFGPISSKTRLASVGLDSLVAIRVASKLRSLNFNISTISVLGAQNLKALARSCEEAPSSSSIIPQRRVINNDLVATLNGHAKDIEKTLPCTPLQLAMLAETVADPKAYQNWIKLDLPGASDPLSVIKNLQALAASNSILRTGFAESPRSDGFVQVVWKTFPAFRIQIVETFNHEFDVLKHIHLHYPIQFQILPKISSISILMHIHHALYDAWSLELLLDDLELLLAGRSLPKRPQFEAVVYEYLEGDLSRKNNWSSQDYWKDHLIQLNTREFPSFHSVAATGLAVKRLKMSVSTSEVEAVARSLSTSSQTIFQAAFTLILGSYLGSSDVCFGTIFSGRTLPIDGIEDIIGPCLATLPVRVDTTTSKTLRELVNDINYTNRRHLEHSAIPLREIKASSGVEPRQLLFDTLLIWQQTLHPYDHARDHVSLVDTIDNLEFKLTLEIIPSIGDVELKANYQQQNIPESQISLLLHQVEQIVKLIMDDSETLLSNVFGLLGKEVLSIENEIPDTKLKGASLSSPVEDIAAHDPHRPAISFASSIDIENSEIRDISYSELNGRANQISRHLIELAVMPDDFVCICLEKSIELYASALAVIKAGAVYLPVLPEVPFDRLGHILSQTKSKIAIAHSCSRLLFKSFRKIHVIYIDEKDFTKFPLSNLPSRFSPESGAYCTFTSGSTGLPKGALVTNENIVSNLDCLEETYPASSSTRFLQSTSQVFDVSVFEIFFTWRVGGCLCSATKDILFQHLENAIRTLGVTHLSFTTTVASLVDSKNVPNVHFLVTAGEPMSPKVFNSWAGRGLWAGYGPTEATNVCSVYPHVDKDSLLQNIGRPLRTTSAFVLAPDSFDPVPRGGEGEFCFGGSQIFRGYLDEHQNEGRLFQHPKFGRLYRSGDYGRLLPDGCMVFSSRKDDQVKIRGQRVELEEISHVLLKNDEIMDCTTILIMEKHNFSQRLVSFWTSSMHDNETEFRCLKPDQKIINKLYQSLNSALPAYMIPSALIPVSILPLTTSGKKNKSILTQLFSCLDVGYLDSTSEVAKSLSDHKWTALELKFATALARVAKIPLSKIHADTSFFSLGIDSISAISLSRNLQNDSGHQILISDILKFPTVAKLANRVLSPARDNGYQAESSTVIDFDFDPALVASIFENFQRAGKSVQRILPCTPLQEAMLSAAESSKDMYDNQVTFKIKGSVEKLQSCWREMVRRHEILRTCFMSTDKHRFPFVQVVLVDHDFEFGSITSLADTLSHAREFEPPYRLDLLCNSESQILFMSLHHALYDGTALSILYHEIQELYYDEPLEPAIAFTPFLQSMFSMNLPAIDEFWAGYLRNCKFPKLIPRTQQSEISTQIHHATLKLPLTWVEEISRSHSTSLLSVFHTVWACVLSEKLKNTDICFGSVVSGRTVPVPGVERLVAPCFNTIPSRLSNIHRLSYLEAFRKIQAHNAEALPFHLTPLRRIQSKLSPDGSRLFDTLFILQKSPSNLDSSIWSIEDDRGAMDFPLVCEITPSSHDNTLSLTLNSYTSYLSENDALSILESFETKLEAALTNPRRQLLAPDLKEEIITIMEACEQNQKVLRDSKSSLCLSEAEVRLRDIFAEFTELPTEKISRDTSIFRLGLDSISTVQVASYLRKQGHSVLASNILEHPTIAQLGNFLARDEATPVQSMAFNLEAFDEKHRENICSKYGISLDRIEVVRPCSPVQQGMIAQTLHSDGKEYMNSMWFELLPETSLSKFQAAWHSACQHHEIFRTGFLPTGDPEYPFSMITYRDFTLPWSEGLSEDQYSTAEQLLHNPWSLNVQRWESKTLVKFTAHHALYDAKSIQMLLSDVARSYLFEDIVRRPPISQLLVAILSQSQSEAKEKEEFWKAEENKIVINRFPDLTPLHIAETANSTLEHISKISVSELEARCRDNGITVQAAGQSAWARILASYIGETSTTFGVILSGRSVHEEANITSFPSIVTLPMRCDVSGTNAELLARTMQRNTQLHRHQFTPLTSIQKWAGFSKRKMFDTLFVYQKIPVDDDDFERPWKIVREDATVDYTVSFEMQPLIDNTLVLRLTFRQDIIPVEQAEIILEQYDALLINLLSNPQYPCDVAPRLDNRLLSITPPKEPVLLTPVALLHEFVEKGAKDHPDKVAFEFATSLEPYNFKSETWTYRELDQNANRIAHLLNYHQVFPGEIIAICFDKCPEASFVIVGILKAGCAYVALDPNAPGDRLRFILKDSKAKIVLTGGNPCKKLIGLIDEKIVNLELESFAGFPAELPDLSRVITPQDASYCLYTSGTTGTPKGCLITHENAVQFMLAFSKLLEDHWSNDSKFLQFSSFHFDVSVMEQFWSWSVGISVVSAPRDMIFEDLSGAIQRLGITHIDLTPSLARLLHPNDVPSLCKGTFITGGEQLKQEILDVWGEYGCIYNGYGPTEATIGCTMYPRVPKNGKPANIGPAYINVGSYVLKPGTEFPVLRGGIGELCISGKLVGKEYLNRPDLTSEKFPTLKAFNERVYRTGDIVRILHDGSFIFLGRADDQVKLRGQRLELSEISQVIKQSINGIDEVVTLVLKHDTQQKEQIVTFFVVNVADDKFLVASMRNACQSRLPGYMVPTHFIPIPKLPLNGNNKADPKQLAAIFNNLTAEDLQGIGHCSPKENQWNSSERKIVSSIASAIGVDLSSVTRSTNIFELGLDSISIIGFSRTLLDAGLENAKLSVVKNNPSLDNLVKALLSDISSDHEQENAYLEASQRIAAFSQKHMVAICNELGIEATDIEAIMPCTPVQEGMIFRFLESDNALYFNKFQFLLDQNVESQRLLAAWNMVISHLEVLRTKFVATDDGFSQVVLRNQTVSFNSFTNDYDAMEKTSALKIPYSLSFSVEPKILTLQIFHGIYDGNSLNLMLRRVCDQYRGSIDIDYGPSFTSSLPFGPLARAPRAEEFWTTHLKDWSPSSFSPLPEASLDTSMTCLFSNLNGFEDTRKRLGVTPQALIQACWIAVLQKVSPNLTVGIVTSGRSIDFENADKVIGPLFNTIPFLARVKGCETLAELTSFCHDFNMQIQNFQHTPLSDILKWISAKYGEPLLQTLFAFQRPEPDQSLFASGVWTKIESDQAPDYPLAFEAILSHDSRNLSITMAAQGSILTRSDVSQLMSRFESCLLSTIQKLGKNLVPSDSVDQNGSAKSAISLLNHESVNDIESNGSFTWTTEAQIIKKEIAVLAKVSEDVVHETSSIFELGLDSIDVIKLSSRLKKQAIEIPVSVIIKCQTITRILARINSKRNHIQKYGPNLFQKLCHDLRKYLSETGKLSHDVETVLPATPLQQSMVNEMIKSGFKRYFNIDAFKIGDDVDISRLRKAVHKVVEASPILRTSFVEIDDSKLPVRYAQLIHNSTTFKLQQELAILGKGETINDFMNLFKEHAALQAAKTKELLQIHYVTGGSINYMAIAISHTLYDGTSLQSIHTDIKRAYDGVFLPRPDFIPFLEEVFNSITEDARKFWKITLSNLPPATFPRKILGLQSINSTTIREKKSRVALPDIEALCKYSRITLQTLGQTCWALVLSQIMGQLDVVFGSVVSCRDSEEAAGIMFPLMNTVAVRSVIHGTLNELLSHMQDMSDTTRQYQHFPLGIAQAYALSSKRNQAESQDTTIFDTLFIYQGRRKIKESKPIYESVYSTSDVEFLMCVEMEVVDEHLVWTTACKPIARNATETEALLEALDATLERIVFAPSSQSAVIEDDGVSICGLPKFRIKTFSPKGNHSEIPNTIETQWTSTELCIRKALHEISSVSEESIHKDATIFHLGLDSILILKLPALLRTYGIILSVSDILKDQTIAAMAKSAQNSHLHVNGSLNIENIIAEAVSKTHISSNLTILEKEIGKVQYIMPVTAGQLYMIRQWQSCRGAIFYPSFTYAIPVSVDKKALEVSWNALLARHDILRTGFFENEYGIVQVTYRNPPNEILYREGNKPIKIRKSNADIRLPPVNLIVETLPNDKITLILVLHHALYDGISLPILIEELQDLYQGRDLPAPPLKFRSFVAQTVSGSQSAVTQKGWRSYLECHAPSAPIAHELTKTYSNKRIEVFHPGTKVKNLKLIAQDIGLSVDAMLLAGLAKIYAQRLQCDYQEEKIPSVVLGVYLANRAPFGEDLSLLVAPTLNLLPLCIQQPLLHSLTMLAKNIQIDIQKITAADMVSASLTDIYEWTGVRVDFFVNIFKSSIKEPRPDHGTSTARNPSNRWEAIVDFGKRATVASIEVNEALAPRDKIYEAYMSPIDVEIRYNGDNVDMGVFAPNDKLSIEEAETLIHDFMNFWI